MTRNDALVRSTGIIVCILVVIVVVMGLWLKSLQRAPVISPIVSAKWVSTSLRFDSNKPSLTWDGNPIDLTDVHRGTEQFWQWIDQQILLEDIETQQVSNETYPLEYIEFFAGRELQNHQYAAYRLLKKSNMFRLSKREYDAEMTYLFPELPINIQGADGERLLSTTEEVVAWKTEVIEQQAYVNRLRQYLAKRRFEEMDRINVQPASPTLELTLSPSWRGWLLVTGILSIEGCTSIPFAHYLYHTGPTSVIIPLPWWLVEDEDCSNLYEDVGLQALERFEVKFTKDDGYLHPSSTVWRLRDSTCQSNSAALQLRCIETK